MMEFGYFKWDNTSHMGGMPLRGDGICRAFARAFMVDSGVDDLTPAAYKPEPAPYKPEMELETALCAAHYVVRRTIPHDLLLRLQVARKAASRRGDLENVLNCNVVWYPPMP